MIAIVLDQSGDESLSGYVYLWIIEAQPGEASGRAAFRDGTVRKGSIACLKAGVGIPSKGPLRGAVVEDGDDNIDSVLRSEVHHLVVIGPIIFTRCNFNCRPHEPVAEDVHAAEHGRLE